MDCALITRQTACCWTGARSSASETQGTLECESCFVVLSHVHAGIKYAKSSCLQARVVPTVSTRHLESVFEALRSELDRLTLVLRSLAAHSTTTIVNPAGSAFFAHACAPAGPQRLEYVLNIMYHLVTLLLNLVTSSKRPQYLTNQAWMRLLFALVGDATLVVPGRLRVQVLRLLALLLSNITPLRAEAFLFDDHATGA